MKHGKKILSILLVLAMFATMSVAAMAEGNDTESPIVTSGEETDVKMKVVCVDAEGTVLLDQEDNYLDLSADVVVDSAYTRPTIEDYTYSKMTVGEKEIDKLTVEHEGETLVIKAFDGEESTLLTGNETLTFVYTKDEEVIVEHTHEWGEGVVTKEATCKEPGEKTYTCSCGETKTEEIPMLNHEWGEWELCTLPTCEGKGMEERICRNSNPPHSEFRDVDALGHDWGEVTYTWADDNSTCTASHTCKRDHCGKEETETVNPTEAITKKPTCTEKGEKTLTAAFTKEGFESQTKIIEVKELGHEYKHGYCTRCDEKDANFKPVLKDDTNGHANWGSDYKVTSDAAKKDFHKVMVDGKDVDPANYSVEEKDGNTLVTLKGSFIKTLSVGSHEVTIVSNTGSASKTISVSDTPKTGDEGMGLWVGLLTLSAMGLATVGLVAKKKFSTT